MTNIIQAIRGMNDILPQETFLWQQVEAQLRTIVAQHGYHEIRLPILEKTELFKRAVGEATDIVEKEMYTFIDRNDENLSLRPEGTAGCVRAGIEHGLLYNQTQRLWYLGPYFRHERPQKGRYRQFHQFGVEVFGMAGPDIDAELILLSAYILEQLGLKPYVNLQLNSLGSLQARSHYRQQLVAYLEKNRTLLDDDSLRRLTTNPLRILDSKNPALQGLIAEAPKLTDYLDEESAAHFARLQELLRYAGLQFTINPCLVRGLDYYSKTVFEWVTTELGAQGTVCAGGRYDSLLEQLGSKPTPALGFAMGMERTILLLQHIQSTLPTPPIDIYILSDSEQTFQPALQLANILRKQNLHVLLHCGGGSLKNQFKKADKSGANYAIIIGEQEWTTHSVAIKSLRTDTSQQLVGFDQVAAFFLGKN